MKKITDKKKLILYGCSGPNVTEKGVVVMCSRVGNAVCRIVVGQVEGITISKESKLEHSHSGESAVLNKLPYLVGNVSKVTI